MDRAAKRVRRQSRAVKVERAIVRRDRRGLRRTERRAALDPEAVDALRRHRETQLLERDFAGPAYTDRDLVFASSPA
jgi:hypothetical protein